MPQRANDAREQAVLAGEQARNERNNAVTQRQRADTEAERARAFFESLAKLVGAGVSEPVLLSEIRPEYSDDGRKAHIQGTVELLIIVSPDGTVKFDSVRKSLGYGLDQKAIEAVKKWTFVAGKIDGKPVPTHISVLVNFSLR